MTTLITTYQGNPNNHAEAHFCTFFDASPPANKMISSYWYDDVTGIAILNDPADVRLGVACGNEGQTGTLVAGSGGGESWG